MVFIIAAVIALVPLWFVWPSVSSYVLTKRRELQVRVLTRQAVRQMSRVSKE